MLTNIIKSILKGLFPYFFPNYILNKVNTEYTKFNNTCSKTKKKLMYSINPNNILESLWLIDYKNKNLSSYQYKFKISINNCLSKAIHKCNSKTQFMALKRERNLYSKYYNNNFRKCITLKKK